MPRKLRFNDSAVTLAHGAGGKASAALVNDVFVPAFANETLSDLGDGAVLHLEDQADTRLAMSTDSFVVQPVFFPGGSIGDLAVNGTVNDLACMGATPNWLSVAFILEEGLPAEDLRRITNDLAKAAAHAGVQLVTGDTKVVEQGAADGLYITTAGVGRIPSSRRLGATQVQPGDHVLVSGTVGDHGTAIMIARGELGLTADISSDTAAISPWVEALFVAAPNTRWLRDPTRGGLGTVCNELAQATNLSVSLEESAIPVASAVTGFCDLTGIDPLYIACEGRFVAVVPEAESDAGLAALKAAGCPDAARIGTIVDDGHATVSLTTPFGGIRLVDMLVGDPLPRIC